MTMLALLIGAIILIAAYLGPVFNSRWPSSITGAGAAHRSDDRRMTTRHARRQRRSHGLPQRRRADHLGRSDIGIPIFEHPSAYLSRRSGRQITRRNARRARDGHRQAVRDTTLIIDRGDRQIAIAATQLRCTRTALSGVWSPSATSPSGAAAEELQLQADARRSGRRRGLLLQQHRSGVGDAGHRRTDRESRRLAAVI